MSVDLDSIEFISQRGKSLIRKIEASEDKELVYERGAGWWVGNKRVAGRDAFELIWAMALRADSFNTETFQRYTVSIPKPGEAIR